MNIPISIGFISSIAGQVSKYSKPLSQDISLQLCQAILNEGRRQVIDALSDETIVSISQLAKRAIESDRNLAIRYSNSYEELGKDLLLKHFWETSDIFSMEDAERYFCDHLSPQFLESLRTLGLHDSFDRWQLCQTASLRAPRADDVIVKKTVKPEPVNPEDVGLGPLSSPPPALPRVSDTTPGANSSSSSQDPPEDVRVPLKNNDVTSLENPSGRKHFYILALIVMALGLVILNQLWKLTRQK